MFGAELCLLPRQIPFLLECCWLVWTGPRLPPWEQLFVKLHGVSVSPEGRVAFGQGVHDHERGMVVGAELACLQRNRFFVDRDRVGVPAEGRVAARQTAQAPRKRSAAIAAAPGSRQREQLFVKLDGVGVPADVDVFCGQYAHGPGVGVFGAVLRFPHHEPLFPELDRIGVPAEPGVAVGQFGQARERTSVVGAEVLGIDRASRLELLRCDFVFAQVLERISERHPQPGFDERLVREALFHEWQSGLEGLPERHVVAQAPGLPFRPGGGEDLVLHEVEHNPRLRLLRLGRLFGFLLRRRSVAGLLGTGLGD